MNRDYSLNRDSFQHNRDSYYLESRSQEIDKFI